MSDVPEEQQPSRPFEPFELAVATVMGLGAIGAAVASFQGGQWGGKMSEAYGEAAVLTTKAATSYNERIADISHDYHVDILAKQSTLQAMYADDPSAKEEGYEIASRMYTSYMNPEGYHALKLPKEAYVDERPDAPDLTPAQLDAALGAELGDPYVDAMLEEAEAGFAAADKKFEEGRHANSVGDEFSLAVVIFTVGIFFAGLATAFKTSVRWVMVGLSGIITAGAGYTLLALPWA